MGLHGEMNHRKCAQCGFLVVVETKHPCACKVFEKPVVHKQKSAFHFVAYCWSIFGNAADELLRAEIAQGNRRNQRLAEFHRHLRTLRDAITEFLEA